MFGHSISSLYCLIYWKKIHDLHFIHHLNWCILQTAKSGRLREKEKKGRNKVCCPSKSSKTRYVYVLSTLFKTSLLPLSLHSILSSTQILQPNFPRFSLPLSISLTQEPQNLKFFPLLISLFFSLLSQNT